MARWLGRRIWKRKVPSSSPGQEQGKKEKKKSHCVVSFDKALYSHCLSPPSCKSGYLAYAGEGKGGSPTLAGITWP